MSVSLKFISVVGWESADCNADLYKRPEADNSWITWEERNKQKYYGYIPIWSLVKGAQRIHKAIKDPFIKEHKVIHILRGCAECLQLGALLFVIDGIVTLFLRFSSGNEIKRSNSREVQITTVVDNLEDKVKGSELSSPIDQSLPPKPEKSLPDKRYPYRDAAIRWFQLKEIMFYMWSLNDTYQKSFPFNEQLYAIPPRKLPDLQTRSAPIIEVMLKDLKEARLSGKTILAYPLNVEKWMGFSRHWTLVVVDLNKRTIEYYDSKQTYGNHEEIVKYLQECALKLTQEDPSKEPYQFVCKINKSLQKDTYQCGPWILYFLAERLRNPDVDFNELDANRSQQMIAKYRDECYSTIIKCAESKAWVYSTKSMRWIRTFRLEDVVGH